jgi:ParB family transcriptional regulator, chromosome partitioning protein
MIIQGRDIPLVLLRPRHERKISKREYARIRASILAVGLIEPLLVFPENDYYVILNGYQRYRILLELGVETVPCIFASEKESFTSNRMVSRLSPLQEGRMIKKSLDELDEKTIATALGITHISHRLNAALLKQLHPSVAAAFDAGLIKRACVVELAYVTPKRQEEILKAMENYKDYTVPFARSLVLKTPQHARAKNRKGLKNPWARSEQRRSDLLKKLADAEEKHDFYTTLYRQYSINLLKLVIYTRLLVTNERIAAYLRDSHPEILATFQEIITNAGGQVAA